MMLAKSTAPLRLQRKPRSGPQAAPWKLLIVDDEPEVHSVTRLALQDFAFDDRGLQFISAHSGYEACQILEHESDIALMLLDVVMETDDAGLKVVEFLRHQLGNTYMRVVLRTGHPGMAPERHVIRSYDINDYRAKTELTQDRMYSLVYTALASYKRLNSLVASQRILRSFAEEYRGLLEGLQTRLRLPLADLSAVKSQLESQGGDHNAALAGQLERSLRQLTEINRGVVQLNELNGQSVADNKEHLDATDLITEAVDNLDPALRQRLAVLNHVDLPAVLGHRRGLVSLFQHLLSNAILHHPGQPTIDIDVHPKGQFWEFVITDDGAGVPVDEWESVFDAFHGSGSGLGLTVCKKIVSSHGGKIWVEHAPNAGLAVHLTLPAGVSPESS